MIDWAAEESEKRILRNVEDLVKKFMRQRNDYQSWYYRPIDAYHTRFDREEWKYLRDYMVGQKDFVADENLFADGGNPK